MSDSKLSIRRKCIKINLVTIALFLLDVSFNEQRLILNQTFLGTTKMASDDAN